MNSFFKPPANVKSALWRSLQASAAADLKKGLVKVVAARPSNQKVQQRTLTGQFANLGYDFRRNLVSTESLGLLEEFARQRGVERYWRLMSEGAVVNASESRAATHMSWRDAAANKLENEKLAELLADTGVSPGVGATRFDHIINVGIGGSEYGPSLVAAAAASRSNHTLDRFISLSSISESDLIERLAKLDLSRTAVIVSSKSFGTVETLEIAGAIKAAYQRANIDWRENFFAVTAAPEKATHWGLPDNQILDMTETVGGRFSIASPIGLSVAMAYGFDTLMSLRHGMKQVDDAVAEDPISSAPLTHALLWVWYRIFFGLQAVAVVPYVPTWRLLTGYLQQLLMESLGKSHTIDGRPVTTPVGSVVIGEAGTNAQHSFMQYVQLGTTAVPIDLIAALDSGTSGDFTNFQLENAVAQSDALFFGAKGHSADTGASGGRPSNLFLTNDDSITSLGALIAFYEHSTVFQAALYDVNPFDQWGVEAGKQIARGLAGGVPTASLQVALEFLGNRITGGFRS